MFWEIFTFELRYWFKRPLIYVYFGVFLLLGFGLAGAVAGLFDNFTGVVRHGKNIVNSPHAILSLIDALCIFSFFIIPSTIGSSIHRDFETGMHSVFFTMPISKVDYVMGRFLGSFLVTFVVFTSIGLGFLLAFAMPGVKPGLAAPFQFTVYWQSYLYYVMPSLLLLGAIVFWIVSITRSISAAFVSLIALFLLRSYVQSSLRDLGDQHLAALLDPYGNMAVDYVTKYWTAAEKNVLLIPMEGVLLANRMIWTTVGVLIFAWTFVSFKFSQFAPVLRWKRNQHQINDEAKEPNPVRLLPCDLSFSLRDNTKLLWILTKAEAREIVFGPSFIVITAIAILLAYTSSGHLGELFGTKTYPVTSQVMVSAYSMFQGVITLLTILYSGILVNRDRKHRIDQLIDTTPTSDWLFLTSKFLALVMMQLLLLMVAMGCGMAIQALNGYYNFEIGLYLKGFLGFHLIDGLLFTVLAVLVQAFTRNYFLGFFILFAYLTLQPFLGQFGVEQLIFKYNSAPDCRVSDMNGFGYVKAHFIYKAYWLALAIVMFVLARLFWPRGLDSALRARFKVARSRFFMPEKWAIAGAFLAFLILGGVIFYDMHFRNEYKNAKQHELDAVEMERKYKLYEITPQLRITDVALNVDIFPAERNLAIKGQYILKNKTGSAIGSIYLNYPNSAETKEFTLGRPSRLVLEDEEVGCRIYRFETPVPPDESVTLDFSLSYIPHGIVNSKSPVIYNGTFFNDAYMPAIGYDERAEISDNEVRKKYGLKHKENMADVNDPVARMNTYISNCGDWINFRATVSTSIDQIALAPGYLQKEWTEKNRRYFEYKMDSPILKFYSFNSARYVVKKDRWNDVNIEIYHHPGHEYNLERMIRAVKKSLEYYTANFSPYPHRQIRIVEFPKTTGTFAQSFPNTIPFSEGIGFIAKVDNKSEQDLDYPFHVTAHEVAHQWWAHQVIGANVKGATVMSETLAEYSALMVMEKEYGQEKMRKFLKYELDNYLRGRGSDQEKEPALIFDEGKGYIHYHKGAMVMYAMKDYLGEAVLNGALKRYLNKVAYQEPPFTNSLEFVSFIKEATPEPLKYLIKDMFETVTLYDNKVIKASSVKTADGKYKVDFMVQAKKLTNDASEGSVLADWIDIGVFGKGNKPGAWKELHLGKKLISAEKTEFSFIVDEEPESVGIDPYNKLIDRNSDDNVRKVN